MGQPRVSDADNWVAVLRAVVVMMKRHHGVEEIALLPIPIRAKRFELTIEGDTTELIRTMQELETKLGKPPGRASRARCN